MQADFHTRVNILKPETEANLLDNLPSKLKKDLDKNLCTCMDVPKLDIIKAILNGATTLEEIQKQTYATMGAGCCIQEIEQLITRISAAEQKKTRSRHKK